MTTSIRAVLFDLDGTLLNTDSVIFSSFLHVLQSYYPDKQWTREEQLTWLGPSLPETFRRYLKPELISTAMDEYRRHNAIHQKDYVTVFPGVDKTLHELRDRNISIGLVTTKTIHASRIGLDLFHLSSFFDCMIGYDEVSKHKPDPESILLALDKLQVLPERALMVGDSVSDMFAAHHAGVRAVGVKWATKGYQPLIEAQADYLIHRMDDLLAIVDSL